MNRKLDSEKIVFIDFDGTIVHVWKRYYSVFCDALKTNDISYDDYRFAKQMFRADDDVAKHLGIKMTNDYYQKKRMMLEDRDYLKHDQLIISKKKLLDFCNKFDCRIITKRREKSNYYWELNKLGLGFLQRASIVLNPDEHISKYNYVTKIMGIRNCIIIGDSEEEAEFSMHKGNIVFIVESGLNSIKTFAHYRNILFTEDINEAFQIINNSQMNNYKDC